MTDRAISTALFIGDCSLDTTLIVERVPEPDEKVHVRSLMESPGGVVANAAVACALAGAQCRILLRTGDDLAAAVACSGLSAAGVSVERISGEGRTCRVVVLLEPHGEKRLLLDPGISMYPLLQQVRSVSLDNVAWVHTAAYGEAASHLVDRCRYAGIRWSLDLEPATFPEGIQSLAPLIEGAETVFCNQRAGRLVGERPADTLLTMGAHSVVLTLGAEGARLLRAGWEAGALSPVQPQVRDTTGAGDCLAGWFVAGRLAGLEELEALQAAVTAAALSCEALGAQASFPDRCAFERFLARDQSPSVQLENRNASPEGPADQTQRAGSDFFRI